MKIKLLSDKAKIPTRGSEAAAGWDLYAATDATIAPHSTLKISTDIAIEIPTGHFGAVFARSGLATKQGLRPANCVGKQKIFKKKDLKIEDLLLETSKFIV